MMCKTVTASFKVTGVYLLNCKAADIPSAVNDTQILHQQKSWQNIKK